MKLSDIKKIAYSILENQNVENSFIEYKKSINFKDKILKTATIDDLNYEYMKEYLVQTNAKQDIRNMSKLDMAKSMGLVSENEYGSYRAKNLLF